MVLRDLWIEHVFWVRNYVLATAQDQTAASEVAEQEIVQNARTIADALIPFYGQPAADGLFQLLAGHWGAIKAYNGATLEAASDAQQTAIADLTANAREIARFLAGANPHLPEANVFGLLSAHGAHHVAQINEISASDFSAEAQTWHAMRNHMLVIADAIGNALARQFPDKF